VEFAEHLREHVERSGGRGRESRPFIVVDVDF
jgi:hypothetical protein